MSSDPPPRFVRHDHRRRLEVVEDELVIGFEFRRHPQADLTRGAAGELDAEERVENDRDLAVRQPKSRMQFGGGGLGVASELAGGGAEGVRGLQRMPALNGLAAASAATEVHGEPAVDRRPRDFGLELFGGAGFDERLLVTMRAGVGKFRLVTFVNLVGRGRRAMAVGAVLFAGFAAGRLRFELGRTFAERRGLTLPGAQGVIELPRQIGDPRVECVHFLSECHAAKASGFVHDPMLSTQTGSHAPVWWALNKYA
ncbi:MAG: hypothetical protein U0791_09695 [Gemmataceae bacterium]